MDGVLYRENQLIPGAADFIQALTVTGAPFLFLTNNSAPTPEDLSVRLKHLGIPAISPRQFYTSALNTADFLSEMDPNCTVFVIGEGGLLAALHERKIANDAIRPAYVVVGEGSASMEKLAKAHECIERGARLLATNPDNWCPVSSEKTRPVPAPPPLFWNPAPAVAPTTLANPMATCSIAPASNSPVSRSIPPNMS